MMKRLLRSICILAFLTALGFWIYLSVVYAYDIFIKALPVIITSLVSAMPIFIIISVLSNNAFVEHAREIKQGMRLEDVIKLMGFEPNMVEHDGDTLIAWWEKKRLRLSRAVKIVFVNNSAVRFATKNFSKKDF